MDRRVFFDAARRSIFRGRLSQTQVDGMNALIDVWSQRYRDTIPPAQFAYCLATSYHETAHTMQAVRETLASSDAQAIARLDAAWRAGKLGQVRRPYWREGFFGRGHVQLTHRDNYVRLGKAIGVDLAGKPALALDPEISADVLFTGMRDGLFTGKRLRQFINGKRRDFRGARAIVNGSDRAGLIAGYADAFLEALEAAMAGAPVPASPMPAPEPEGPAAPDIAAPDYAPPYPDELVTGKPPGTSTTIWTAILQTLIGSGAAILAALQGLAPWLAALIVVSAIAAGVYIARERLRHARESGV